jgi:hypothetical protein
MHAAGQSSLHPPSGITKDTRTDNRTTAGSVSDELNEHDKTCAQQPKPGTGQNLSNDQVYAALERALNSTEFQSAPQLRSFLKFVVQATLTRRRGKIKGYMIAVEALGRSEDFNPVIDPIVRVEAARLRRRLKKFYDGSGAADPVRISIPKGSYAPEFCRTFAGVCADNETEDPTSLEMPGNRHAFHTGSKSTPGQNRVLKITGFENRIGNSGRLHNFSISNEANKAGQSETSLRSPQRNSGFLFKAARQLQGILQIRISVLTAIALGVACFVTGYIVASS